MHQLTKGMGDTHLQVYLHGLNRRIEAGDKKSVMLLVVWSGWYHFCFYKLILGRP